MLPVVAILGRTNVGKSTLFNRLLREKKALTHDRPGVTRDRVYGEVHAEQAPFALVDTGGLEPDSSQGLDQEVFAQAREALEQAQLILLLVDCKRGLTAVDEELAQYLRKTNKPLRLVVNKVDGPEREQVCLQDFYALGLEMLPVSAAHGYNMPLLLQSIQDWIQDLGLKGQGESSQPGQALHLALLGRPNVGKSSLINSILGEKRLIVSPDPGTTRDSVDVVLQKEGRRYIFLDTAGVRRRTRIRDSLERFSVLRALKSSKRAQVTILVLDALQGLSQQDKKLLSFLEQEKVPLLIAVNKVDLVPRKDRGKLKGFFEQELRFCPYVPKIYTSSVTRAGLGGLLPLAEKLWEECNRRVGTGELNRLLQQAVGSHQPPMVKQRRPKFYYLTQAQAAPPTFVFFVNDHTLIQPAYARYLEKQIRKIFGFVMSPVQLVFRTSQG
ncbi:MAG: ribosome biogenesis GTPase Der [Thermodesulfobacteriota bacterium]